jgi:hypothetical protein
VEINSLALFGFARVGCLAQKYSPLAHIYELSVELQDGRVPAVVESISEVSGLC